MVKRGVMRPFGVLERLRKKSGYFVNDILIWHKNNPIPLHNRLTNAIEYIFVLSKQPQIKYQTKEYTHNVFKYLTKGTESCRITENLFGTFYK